MKSRQTIVALIVALAVLGTVLLSVFLMRGGEGGDPGVPESPSHVVGAVPVDAPSGDESVAEEDSQESEVSEAESSEAEEPLSEEERRERELEALVDSFDALTDKWMEPAENGVSMEDVDEFSGQFRKVPPDRREDCLRRALNLIPDENVMLLAGILMDKSMDRELVELAYNDILNRDEDVKQPILLEIFKDKSHPCWADTAWILDVTDQTPEK